MSKTIYYIELKRLGQAPSKFKFAIDNTKKVIRDIKQELKGRLVQKKAIEDTHEIILRDKQLFELCSDDEIDDVVIEADKNIIVSVKGEDKSEPSVVASSSVSIAPGSSIVGSAGSQSNIPIQAADFYPLSAVNALIAPPATKISDCLLRPTNHVKPFEPEKHDQSQIQIKFTCPQMSNPEIQYGIVVPKKITFYELSTVICQLFSLEGKNNLKALLYHFNGQPLIWSTDYMSLYLPEIDDKQTFTVIFTAATSTSETPVEPLKFFDEKHLIFVKVREPIGFKVDIEKTTVGDLQSFVFNKFRIHPLNQLIKFGAKTLLDATQPLHVYGLVENSMVEVAFKPRHRITALTYSDNFYTQQVEHTFPQSIKAKRTFRSNMLILCHRLPAKLKIKLLALLRELTHNHALVCALDSLFHQCNITETHKIALEEGMLTLFIGFLSKAKDVPVNHPSEDIFSLTRECLGFYLQTANKLKDMDEYEQRENFKCFSPICEVTLQSISDPIYVKLDNNSKVVSERSIIMTYIKNNLTFRGVAKLSQGNIMEDKDLKEAYKLFTFNGKIVEVAGLQLRLWLPKILDIDYLKKQASTLSINCKYNDFTNTMAQVNPDMKVFNPLELKTKVDYVYLLKDKSNEEKIYVCKNKDIHTPHGVYDVITGAETAVNFDVMGGVAGSESVDKLVNPVDIKAIVTRQPAEAIVVLLDISGSMGGKFFNEPDLKRIGAVKSFFEALAYRTMAYNFQHVISLILFDDKVEVKVDFTESFHDFNLLVSNAHPRGSTLLYDAMVVATQNLLNLKKKYPNCILRILALTDGEDTGSKSSIVDTSQLLIDHHILVDSFVVGSNCEGLKCISFAAGGKCYLARDIQESLKLFEQETVLSARSRKAEAKIAYENVAELVERMKLRPFDMPNNVHEFKLPDIGKPAIDVKNLAEQLHKDPNKLNHIAPTGSLKRIVKELTNYQANPHPFVSIYPCEDMTLWKILLLGPQKTPYEGGLFQLYAKFPSDYPFKPPEVRFVTPIYHCNMNSQGRICHSVFDRNYSPAITFKTIIDSIYGLILTPEPDDPLDNVVATYFLSNYQQYYENAVKATKANASKGVQEIVENLFGKITDDNERQKKTQEIRDWIKKAEASN